MEIEVLSRDTLVEKYLKNLNVDAGGVAIMASKAAHHLILLRDLHVGAANILNDVING